MAVGTIDAAVWVRVSGDGQDESGQIPGIERFVAARGLNVVRTYTLHGETAWKNGGSAEYRANLAQLKKDAHAGLFSVAVVWSLDRIIRQGPEEALRLIRELSERGCALMSVQEDWLNTSSEIQPILVSFAGWMAEQESRRKSERVRAAMQRPDVRANIAVRTVKPGNKVRGKDKKPRVIKAGNGWSEERRAAAAERMRLANLARRQAAAEEA